MKILSHVKHILISLALLSQHKTFAALSCVSLLQPSSPSSEQATKSTPIKTGAQILHEKDGALHTSALVERATSQHAQTTGVVLSKPADKLTQWLDYLTKISTKAGSSTWAREQIKTVLNNQYVLKLSDIPESYYALQIRLARERGQGNIRMTENQKQELAKQVIADQRASLEPWLEYLVSKDTAMYPMWIKYWMFTGMVKLSKYDPVTGTFGRREKGTVSPFPSLNREALARIFDLIVQKTEKQSLSEMNDPEMLKYVEGMNFGKLYGKTLLKLSAGKTHHFITNKGKWILYPKDSDPNLLAKSLEGKNTGWCTAGVATAKSQLEQGDFHVYYSLDTNGEATIPRLAIRMVEDQIEEIRGVTPDQDLDPQIVETSILSDRLTEMKVDATQYTQKTKDMKYLTAIESKHKLGSPLTKEDLNFLYEIERPIEHGFGYKKDPRIQEIIKNRNLHTDLTNALQGRYTKEEIAINQNDIVHGVTKVFHGNLILEETNLPENYVFPEIIFGTLYLENLTAVKSVAFPQFTRGLYAPKIKTAENVAFPMVKSNAYHHPWPMRLDELKSIKNVTFAPHFEGHLNLESLQYVENSQLPHFVSAGVSLNRLQYADGLKLPDTIQKGELNLRSLPSAKGLAKPAGKYRYVGPNDFDSFHTETSETDRARKTNWLIEKFRNFFQKRD